MIPNAQRTKARGRPTLMLSTSRAFSTCCPVCFPPRDWHPSTQRRACARAQNTWLNKHVWVYIRLYICIVSSMFIKTPKQQQQEDVPPLLESGKQGEIWHRDLHGPFQTLRDLWDAPGNTLAELKERCRISYVNDYVNQVTE